MPTETKNRLSLRVLWALWAGSVVVLFGVWWLGFESRSRMLVDAQRLAVVEGLDDLEESFDSLVRMGPSLVQQTLRSSEWNQELAGHGEPYYKALFLTAEDDLDALPPWLKMRVESLPPTVDSFVWRPLPPGFSTESVFDSQEPESYLIYGCRPAPGRTALWILDWDYLKGDWLRRRLQRLGPSEVVTGRFLTLEDSLNPLSQSQKSLSHWRVPTLVLQEQALYPPLEVTLHRTSLVRRAWQEQLWLLFGGGLLMTGFAVVLVLTTRTLRREAELSEAKAHFVSMVGHELRTPITALEMYLEILREGMVSEPEKVDEYHRILQKESGRLKSLVENLLALGLQQSGSLNLQMKKVEVVPLVSEVVESLNREGRDIVWRVSNPRISVRADKDALYSIVSNLVANALKYSPEGVEIRLEERAGACIIGLADRGQALSPPEYERVFEPYYRSRKEAGGLGLGLALVRQLAQAMDGKAWGEARDGGGSLFAVQLPRG